LDQTTIDVIRQLVGQLPDRERFDASLLPQSRGHVTSDVTHSMLENVAMPGVHHHPGVRPRGEPCSQRSSLASFTPVEIRVERVITPDFETETDGRPHEISEPWIERVVPGCRGRIPT